jgi:UDP-N-acetylenolpyruvoylglucosamine reductase
MLEKIPGSVGGAVIDNDDFLINRHIQYKLKDVKQGRLLILDRNDDGK